MQFYLLTSNFVGFCFDSIFDEYWCLLQAMFSVFSKDIWRPTFSVFSSRVRSVLGLLKCIAPYEIIHTAWVLNFLFLSLFRVWFSRDLRTCSLSHLHRPHFWKTYRSRSAPILRVINFLHGIYVRLMKLHTHYPISGNIKWLLVWPLKLRPLRPSELIPGLLALTVFSPCNDMTTSFPILSATVDGTG